MVNIEKRDRITEVVEGFTIMKNLLSSENSIEWEVISEYINKYNIWQIVLTETHDEAFQESIDIARITLDEDLFEISFSEYYLGINLENKRKEFLPYKINVTNHPGNKRERYGYIFLKEPEELIRILGILSTIFEKNI